jgi:hypothetical protein
MSIDSSLQAELLREFGQLPPNQQWRVVEFARTLGQAGPKGIPGTDFLELAGTLSREEAQEMLDAIEEGCERVDPHGW